MILIVVLQSVDIPRWAYILIKRPLNFMAISPYTNYSGHTILDSRQLRSRKPGLSATALSATKIIIRQTDHASLTLSAFDLPAPPHRRILENNSPRLRLGNKLTIGRVSWLLGNPQPIQPPRLPTNHADPTQLQIQNTHNPPCLPANLENPLPTRIPLYPHLHRLHPSRLKTRL